MTVNMFCLPPAGSSAAIYASWKKLVSEQVSIIPVEYPGHGALVKQPLVLDPDYLSHYILEQIQSYGDRPFMLFGHSVGAALTWRVEQLIRSSVLSRQLKLLVISGRPELEFTSQMALKRFLSREGLIDALRYYNAVPAECLQNPDIMDFFLTILRNDFHLNDNMLNDSIEITDTPVMAFYGESDPDIAGVEQMEAWQKHSRDWRGCYALEGDHFFFNRADSLDSMLEKICDELESLGVLLRSSQTLPIPES